MAQRFVSLEEAARTLGIPKERLNELREAGKARAFRDGTSWKFKEEEVERLAAQGVTDLLHDAASVPAPEAVTEDQTAEGSDSILLSELELGADGANQGSSSTIIGQEQEAGEDSDLKVAAPGPSHDGSDLQLETDGDLTLGGDDSSRLEGDESHVLRGSTGGSGVLDEGPLEPPGSQFEKLEELDLDLDLDSSQLSFADDSVAGRVEPGLRNTGTAAPARDQVAAAAEFEPAESSIKLAADEDDEVVLGEDAAGDITLDSHQSGISLVDASDTGISLDEAPIDLGGSAVESLDLSGDDTVTVSDQSEEGSSVGSQDGDDFVLTSVADATGSSGAGSGSQVVAFDLESGIDENTATILGGEASLGSDLDVTAAPPASILEEEVEEAPLPTVAAPGGASSIVSAAAFREAQYSGSNITSLVLCVVLLFLSGAMMFDLLRSMWSWNKPYAVNSAIMDAILNALF
ncbi:MAG: hypothetical protein A2W31_13710 [Planctomycetes bacterium RBG_16_64_10]|nr:MAG: hypothetical protein A2W31_13710 [Planctomycetes bacterium RBG_16_64_10]